MSGDSSPLGKLLSKNLAEVQPPSRENYELLRTKLASVQPNREPPKIKESPENMRQP